VKIYYTIRELSNHAAELLRCAAGDEDLRERQRRGDAWLQQHLAQITCPRGRPQWKDAAIIDRGCSRWTIITSRASTADAHVGIDACILTTGLRSHHNEARAQGPRSEPPRSLIDVHSANQYDPHDGSAVAPMFTGAFPYINRLWFGEYFDPNSPPDFWLTELSASLTA